MSRTALPKPITKPVTAYEFFEKLIGVMKEEPARVDQGDWLRTGKENIACEVKDGLHGAAPACGTVGCTAGWASILLGYKRFPDPDKVADDLGLNILGDTEFNQSIQGQLFSHEGYNGNVTALSGTKQHMNQVVSGIRDFMNEYKPKLKRILVYPKGR